MCNMAGVEKLEQTKASMLKYLKQNIPSINILPILVVSSKQFEDNVEESVNLILDFAQNRKIIVRSSTVEEY